MKVGILRFSNAWAGSAAASLFSDNATVIKYRQLQEQIMGNRRHQ